MRFLLTWLVRLVLIGAFTAFAWDARQQLSDWKEAASQPKVLEALLWGLQIVAKLGAAFVFLLVASRRRLHLGHVFLVALMLALVETCLRLTPYLPRPPG